MPIKPNRKPDKTPQKGKLPSADLKAGAGAASPARTRPPTDKSARAAIKKGLAPKAKAGPPKRAATAQKGVLARRLAASTPSAAPIMGAPRMPGLGMGHMSNARNPLGRGAAVGGVTGGRGVGAGQGMDPPSAYPQGQGQFPGSMPMRRGVGGVPGGMPPGQTGVPPGQGQGGGQPGQIGQQMAQFRRPQPPGAQRPGQPQQQRPPQQQGGLPAQAQSPGLPRR